MKRRTISLVLLIILLVITCGMAQSDTSVIFQKAVILDDESAESNMYSADNSIVSSLANTYANPNDYKSDSDKAGALAMVDDGSSNQFNYTLAFAGDINLDDNWSNMVYYHNNGDDIYNCIDEVFINEMNAADIMWINNEFTYSYAGAPLAGKAYTFRANPANVEILNQLGVDIVGLANNHVYDYGKEAFLDTLDTLVNSGIPYVGAGRNIEEASRPVYMQLGDLTIAYVAASRAEKYKMTPEATDSTPGILRCYDPEKFITSIREASENADFVVALPHWGTEYSTTLEKAQTTTAREYIDAGADVVIGAHSHCLQGMEYYNESLIAYSLGNYWFNEKTLDTMLLEVDISGVGSIIENVDIQIIPGTQSGWVTTAAKTPEEKERIYKYIESISIGIEVDKNGYVLNAS
mgnify:FL=1